MANTITLSPTQQKIIEQKVRSGGYPSESEVMSESLALLEERDRYLREKVREAMASGGSIPAQDVYAELRAQNNAQRRKGV
jgi:putative addiction module CopG family antidote